MLRDRESPRRSLPGPVTALGIAARTLHLAASIAVVGAFAAVLLARRSDRPAACAWDARVVRLARLSVVIAMAAGAGVLAHQVAVIEGRASALLEVSAIARVVGETQAGIVWLARHALLAVLGAFLAFRMDTTSRSDWLAVRGEGALLGGVALGLLGLSGHAVAVEPDTSLAVAVDVLHLLAAGAWAGALVPIALLVRSTSHPTREDARPYTVLAVRRFSRLALVCVLVLLVTGVANGAAHVGTVAGLVGTPYGRLLAAKLALLVPLLALAGVTRRLWPSLSGDADVIARPAMRRLARFVALEAILALAVLAVVGAMTLIPPARHEQPTWPLAFRLSLDVVAASRQSRVLVASQVAVLGLVALAAAAFVARRRSIVILIGAALVVAGTAVGLPPLAVDAYPTTYWRPTVPYHATSVAAGKAIYERHCARCHGGDGSWGAPTWPPIPPSPRSRPGEPGTALDAPIRPRDLRSAHTAQHTAGDLYWWVTHGIPARGMPAFDTALDDHERWDVVNLVRALGAARGARALGPRVEPDRPRLVAPDFSFTVGPASPRSLRDYRGRRAVLVVLYTLPGSRARLAALAASGRLLTTLGADVVAVPSDASPDAIREIGGESRFVFPVATGGAEEIVAAYSLFAPGPHAEFLVDRQGYLRAIVGSPSNPDDVNPLLAELQQLNEEKTLGRPAGDHVH
jgi:putative copper resistance protein D